MSPSCLHPDISPESWWNDISTGEIFPQRWTCFQEDGEVKDGEVKDGEAKDGETKAVPRQPENSFWRQV